MRFSAVFLAATLALAGTGKSCFEGEGPGGAGGRVAREGEIKDKAIGNDTSHLPKNKRGRNIVSSFPAVGHAVVLALSPSKQR